MEILQNEQLKTIGKKYNKAAAQIALKFLVQSGITIIPKVDSKEILEQNIDLFDFHLTDNEMEKNKAMDEDGSFKSDYGNLLGAEYAYSEYIGMNDKMFD